MEIIERHSESLDWITLILVVCFVIFAVSRFLYSRRFQEFMMLPITNKYFVIGGKNDELGHAFNVLLFISQVAVVSLFVYLIFSVFRPEYTISNSWLFIQICTAYLVFVVAKLCVEKIVGAVFDIEKEINNYLYQKLSYRNLIGMLIFIGNVLFFYFISPSKMALLIFVGIIVVLNGISLFSSYKSYRNLILKHFFYFILYLCALEISPYVLLFKWVG